VVVDRAIDPHRPGGGVIPRTAGLLARVEDALAEASAPGGPMCPDDLLALDDHQTFPDEAVRFLDQLGTAEFYVARGNGDILDGLTDLTSFIRLLARRDLTIAVAHAKTFLGAVCVWLAGETDQRERLAAEILNGAIVSWALTERGHGADLLACRVRAEPSGDGWSLTGEKWLINNATRGHLVCVLARTRPAGGPRGFSLFLFDKRTADPGTWRTVPKVPTHGVRGADISGIKFTASTVSAEAMVGAPGTGLETTLKALQLTRTISCGLSLGALEHALAIGAGYARNRTLYGKRLADVPNIQQELGRCVATLHIAEAVIYAATRLAVSATSEMAVISAVAKALVPELCQEAISAIGEVLGLRGFLTSDEPYRSFQKLDRDHRVVAIFDGSTAVCRSQVIEHFPLLSREVTGDVKHGDLLGRPAQPPEADRLSLLTRRCSLVAMLSTLREYVGRQAAAGDILAWIPASAAAAEEALGATRARMAELSWAPHNIPEEAFDVARDFELCFAAAAVCQLWAHAHTSPDRAGQSLWVNGLWLGGALAAIEDKLPDWLRTGVARGDVFGLLARQLLESDDGQVPSLLRSRRSTS
jgi:alkylation response protein AidB-like acyl-CoA dehydrogenase